MSKIKQVKLQGKFIKKPNQKQKVTKHAIKQVVTKTNTMKAVYLIQGNVPLTVQEVIKYAKFHLNISLTPLDVYRFRAIQRRKGLMPQHKSSVPLTFVGVEDARMSVALKVKK